MLHDGHQVQVRDVAIGRIAEPPLSDTCKERLFCSKCITFLWSHPACNCKLALQSC